MEPILILAQPRSGSSMTAGVFMKHGVWVGSHRQGDTLNAKGHFENIPLRQYFHGLFPNVVPSATPAEATGTYREDIERLIRQDGYTGGHWLFKCTAMYYPAFHEFEPFRIGVIRPPEQIFASCRKTGMVSKDESILRDNIRRTQAYIHQISDVIVDSDAVAHGDFETIRQAIEHCGLEWDEAAARDFVNPKLWRYGS